MKQYQAEWNKTGPVGRNEREAINERFKTLADKIYGKIQHHFTERREQLTHNAEAKQALIDRINAINATDLLPENAEATFKEVVALQEAWKGTGNSTKNEEYWQTFRTACDEFFNHRKALLRKGDKVREAHKQTKIALCEKAEVATTQHPIRSTSDILIKLQKEWRTIGSAGKSDENRLWNRFREACDKFFAAKKEHFPRIRPKSRSQLTSQRSLDLPYCRIPI